MAAPVENDERGELEESDILADFADVCPDPPEMRRICKTCKRPATVCWCPYLPHPPPDVSTTVYILQHPFEETRRLQTAPMLYHGLPSGKCNILKGKRFSTTVYPELAELVENPQTLLLYPGPNARDIASFPVHSSKGPYSLILLDGTWAQARGIYTQNKFLHSVQQVQITNAGLSEYVIRTQPMDGCLSTLETAALAIGLLENKPQLRDVLVQPLRALCDFQLQYGAVKHQSRQYLIEQGLYEKQMPKKHMKSVKNQANNIKQQINEVKDNIDEKHPLESGVVS